MNETPGKAIYYPTDYKIRKPSYRCPFCGVVTTIKPLIDHIKHWVCKCDSCGETFYAKVDYEGTIGDERIFRVIDTYPKFTPRREESVPEGIWNDYLEAVKCLDAGAFKATVVMCRRTLQNSLLEKGAPRKKPNGRYVPLHEQINKIFPEKNYSLIRDWAGEIKFLGDYGAHPQDDGLDEVDKEDAEDIVKFTLSYLEQVYIGPGKIATRRAARSRPR